jgi:hypothetical protein
VEQLYTTREFSEIIIKLNRKKRKKNAFFPAMLVEGIIVLNVYFKYMIHFHRVILNQYIITNWNKALRFKKKISTLRKENAFLRRLKISF